MTTHLIRRDATFTSSPPPVNIERRLLYVRPHPTHTPSTPSHGGLHGACTPGSGLFGVFIDEPIQEMCERIEGQVWTARQRLIGEQLTC
jgi:hypothetical protein